MRSLPLFLAFLLSSALFASFTTTAASNTCNATAERATQKHLIITMEGLFSGSNGRAASLARQAVGRASSGAGVVPFAWTQSDAAAQCAAYWKKLYGSSLKVTFVGHSFGGGKGAFPLMNKLASLGIRVNHMVVLDGRVCDGQSGAMCKAESSCANQGGRVFNRPANVDRVINFYQCGGGLHGRKFREGPGVVNMQLNGSHIGLPRDPSAMNHIAGLLKTSQSSEDNIARIEGDDAGRPNIFRPTRRAPASVTASGSGRRAWCFSGAGAVRFRCTYEQASSMQYGETTR